MGSGRGGGAFHRKEGGDSVMNFERAFEKLLGHEGGFVDHPKDPGGSTRY
ncbi:MAG: hypothetical protein KDE20_16255, partial [Caldilineaceae bacterium]|nr:hypothetical protein [Caldilineaceae bacterium]